VAESVERAIAGGLLPSGQAVLVACSGGADSVALAAALGERRQIRTAIGHVDHGLRPESAREAEQVRALAQRLEVPFFLERLEGVVTKGPGLEAAAREGRYAALARLAARAGASVVATAHTRRDQAETLLLRLVRGAGPGALAGVRRQRPLAPGIVLVRPLLDVPRAATEAFCREHGLSPVEDPHNVDPARTRARLRRLWPALLELNPRLEQALAGAAESLADEDELLSAMLPADLRLETLRALPPALLRRTLLRAAQQASVHPERPHLEELRKLLAKGRGSLDLPAGRAAIRDGELQFRAGVAGARSLEPGACSPATHPSEVAVPGPGHYAWRARELIVAAGSREGVTVDLARAPFPWTLRAHRAGDRFRPGGGKTKKVSDLWIDARIPRDEREGLAILCDARGRLFWVEGLRAGDPARGEIAAAASFRVLPEMKPVLAALTSRRRRESASATMDPRPGKEPR
jgi:tRNA(Ile)-lysidine synthase